MDRTLRHRALAFTMPAVRSSRRSTIRDRTRINTVATRVLAAVVIAVSSFSCASPGVSHAEDACTSAAVRDDFEGPAGAPPDPQLWNYHIGAGGTDGQLQAYTKNPRNGALDGNGNLAIVAIQEPIPMGRFGTFDYSSAWLDTHGALDFCYGTVAARIKLPTGQGLRPAFWLLGSDFKEVGWPQCGEIDVMELPNNGSSLHGPGGYLLHGDSPVEMGTGWHEYVVDWSPGHITTSADGKVLGSWTPESLPDPSAWTFDEDHPMYVILNMSIGGIGGGPDQSTVFPATMLVDWLSYEPNFT